MFRRTASLALPHLKSFAAIPSVSLVQLGHTNRSVFLPHESQREIALVQALSRPIPLLPTRRSGGRKMGLCFATFVFLTFRGPLASHDSNPYPNRSRIARYNATKIWTNGMWTRSLLHFSLCCMRDAHGGAKFYTTPSPPPLKIAFCGGGTKRGGGHMKFLPRGRGGFKIPSRHIFFC